MGLFSFLKGRNAESYFTKAQIENVVASVKEAERRTSGEVRVFIETSCNYVDALDRAIELFFGLKMEKTDHRNAVLVYVAMKDHQFAIFGDEGIYTKMGAEYWNAEAGKMLHAFKNENFADGIVTIVNDIGYALANAFPYDQKGDKNELPDDIIFGN